MGSIFPCLAGAIVDGLNHRAIEPLTACSTSSSYGGAITHYGRSEGYFKSDYCIPSYGFKADACYCTTGKEGRFSGLSYDSGCSKSRVIISRYGAMISIAS